MEPPALGCQPKTRYAQEASPEALTVGGGSAAWCPALRSAWGLHWGPPVALLRAQSWETQQARRAISRLGQALQLTGWQGGRPAGLRQCPMVCHFTFIATALLSPLSPRQEAWLSGNLWLVVPV